MSALVLPYDGSTETSYDRFQNRIPVPDLPEQGADQTYPPGKLIA